MLPRSLGSRETFCMKAPECWSLWNDVFVPEPFCQFCKEWVHECARVPEVIYINPLE